jgi:hypothetical protein
VTSFDTPCAKPTCARRAACNPLRSPWASRPKRRRDRARIALAPAVTRARAACGPSVRRTSPPKWRRYRGVYHIASHAGRQVPRPRLRCAISFPSETWRGRRVTSPACIGPRSPDIERNGERGAGAHPRQAGCPWGSVSDTGPRGGRVRFTRHFVHASRPGTAMAAALGIAFASTGSTVTPSILARRSASAFSSHCNVSPFG